MSQEEPKQTIYQQRLQQLRKEMEKRSITHFFSVVTDPHMTEFTHPFYRHIEWLCGFTGFTAQIVVTQTSACFWTDSVNYLQAQEEVDKEWKIYKLEPTSHFTPCSYILKSKKIWLGYNPETTHYVAFAEFENKKNEIKFLQVDLLNVIHKQSFVLSKVQIFEASKVSVKRKLQLIRDKYKQATVLLSNLSDVNWCFNIRGHDIPYSPVCYGYALINPNSCYLFICN